MVDRVCALDGCLSRHHGLGFCLGHYAAYHQHGDPLYRPPTETERFWVRVDTSAGPDGCWVWTGFQARRGYGQLWFGGRKSQRAHRVSWLLVNGPIPDGLWVLHHCDNPPCCNPAHLFLGTTQMNTADMDAKGRRRCALGSAHGMARLTEPEVAVIKRRLIDGENHHAIAADYPVSESMIRRIRTNRNWTHVVAQLRVQRATAP